MQTHRLSFCKWVEVHIPCTFEIIVKILLKIVPSNSKYHDIAPSTFPPTLPGTWVQKGQPSVHLNSYLVQRESTMQKILLFKMPLSCLLGKEKKTNNLFLLLFFHSFGWFFSSFLQPLDEARSQHETQLSLPIGVQILSTWYQVAFKEPLEAA